VPALNGAALTARHRDRPETALEHYRAVLSVSAEVPAVVRKRLAELKLQITERSVAAARRALEQGATDQAIEEYQRALRAAPEVGGVRLELAELLLRGGKTGEAASLLAAAPGDDRQVLLKLGDHRVSAEAGGVPEDLHGAARDARRPRGAAGGQDRSAPPPDGG
jgi:thioredoxin-like negative regulator of GroEL